VFDARFSKLAMAAQKMDSNGIKQTTYKIINATVNAENTPILAELYPSEQ